MSTQITQERAVSRPTPAPVTSSVLEHATVVDMASFGLRNSEGLWPSYNCMDTLTPVIGCPTPTEPLDFNAMESAEWQPSFEFAVYGATKCNAVGLDDADQKAELERVFTLNEGRGVESALLERRFVEDDDTTHAEPWWSAPKDVTPATPVSLLVALALLEGDAAANYAGLPTIHMPRAAATVLEGSGVIVWNGNKAFTKNGSKVAIGGGYDQSLEDGLWDMYATGEVYVERSTRVTHQQIVLPGSADAAKGYPDNTVIALTQRMYRVAVDCYVAKATGKVW